MSARDFKTGQVLFAGSTIIPRTVKRTIAFTTAVIQRDFLLELGLHIVRVEITNRDPGAAVLLQMEPFAIADVIPGNSRGELTDEIHSGFTLTPDAASGIGTIKVFLAPTEELVRLGLIGS